LTRAEIETVCHVAIEAGCKGITTSTGIDGRIARTEDVRLIKDIVGENLASKPSAELSTARRRWPCLKRALRALDFRE
jgi:deoxyribose-phosphate aldolase